MQGRLIDSLVTMGNRLKSQYPPKGQDIQHPSTCIIHYWFHYVQPAPWDSVEHFTSHGLSSSSQYQHLIQLVSNTSLFLCTHHTLSAAIENPWAWFLLYPKCRGFFLSSLALIQVLSPSFFLVFIHDSCWHVLAHLNLSLFLPLISCWITNLPTHLHKMICH